MPCLLSMHYDANSTWDKLTASYIHTQSTNTPYPKCKVQRYTIMYCTSTPNPNQNNTNHMSFLLAMAFSFPSIYTPHTPPFPSLHSLPREKKIFHAAALKILKLTIPDLHLLLSQNEGKIFFPFFFYPVPTSLSPSKPHPMRSDQFEP